MKTNFDDIFNKLIDNELNIEGINKVKSLNESNPEFNIKLRTHQFVHNSLFDIKVIEAPKNITEKIMKNILSKMSVKYQKSYFFRAVISILLVSLLTVFFMIVFYPANPNYTSETNSLFNQMTQIIEPILNKLNSFFWGKAFKSIGGLISVIIFLSFYFIINTHKEFKGKINDFSNRFD